MPSFPSRRIALSIMRTATEAPSVMKIRCAGGQEERAWKPACKGGRRKGMPAGADETAEGSDEDMLFWGTGRGGWRARSKRWKMRVARFGVLGMAASTAGGQSSSIRSCTLAPASALARPEALVSPETLASRKTPIVSCARQQPMP
eukprot:356003-Chlamydomonas_euryale.AAC.4